MKQFFKSFSIAIVSILMCTSAMAAEISSGEDINHTSDTKINPNFLNIKVSQSKSEKLTDPFYSGPISNDEYDYHLYTYTTPYSTSKYEYNRNVNLQLAADAINGTVLQPGDEFSYNKVILEKSNGGKGYLSAGIFINGKSSTGIGGGICQVSSTLFQAALHSGMTITARKSHTAKVSYLPAGRDAAVSWGSLDFKFRNNLSTPVKIQAHAKDGEVLVRFWAIDKPLELGQIETTVTQTGRQFTISRFIDGVCDYSSTSRYNN